MVNRPLRQLAPDRVVDVARRGAVDLGERSARWRMTPDTLVIGAQRSGTTSLFRALMAHPRILRPVMHKGVNYFDLNYDRGFAWYRGHFPLRAATRLRTRGGGPVRVFEASGYYLFHPAAAERIARDLPHVRVVAMLRDPVERAFSAWKHERARGFETEDFETALALEDDRIAAEAEQLDRGEFSFAHRHHAYRRRGDYPQQLRRYAERLPGDRLHVIYSEDFFARPDVELDRLWDFLEVPRDQGVTVRRYNARPSADMPETARARLGDHYETQRGELEDVVGRPAPWSR